jgi:hypothetical protein
MTIVPSGSVTIGAAPLEGGDGQTENPRTITIARPFAVGKLNVTLDEWNICVADGGCKGPLSNSTFAIGVNWNGAREYVAWLSKTTGKTYRLLSEAEFDYVLRGGRASPATAWKDFDTNAFGIGGMNTTAAGEWVEDCFHADFNGAPTDGSPWATGDCGSRVVRQHPSPAGFSRSLTDFGFEKPFPDLKSPFEKPANPFLNLPPGRRLVPSTPYRIKKDPSAGPLDMIFPPMFFRVARTLQPPLDLGKFLSRPLRDPFKPRGLGDGDLFPDLDLPKRNPLPSPPTNLPK